MYFVTTVPKTGTHLLRHILGMKPTESVKAAVHVLNNYPGDMNDLGRAFYLMGRLYSNGMAGHWPAHKMLVNYAQYVPSFTILRDPRDAIVSHFYHVDLSQRHQMLTNDPFTKINYKDYEGADRMDVLIETVHRQMEEYLPWLKTDIVAVRYEEILENPEKALIPVAEATGDDLGYLVERSKFKGTRTFRKGLVGEWKHEFNSGQKKRFNELYGHIMEAWGYD